MPTRYPRVRKKVNGNYLIFINFLRIPLRGEGIQSDKNCHFYIFWHLCPCPPPQFLRGPRSSLSELQETFVCSVGKVQAAPKLRSHPSGASRREKAFRYNRLSSPGSPSVGTRSLPARTAFPTLPPPSGGDIWGRGCFAEPTVARLEMNRSFRDLPPLRDTPKISRHSLKKTSQCLFICIKSDTNLYQFCYK